MATFAQHTKRDGDFKMRARGADVTDWVSNSPLLSAMFLTRRPSHAAITRFLESQATSLLSYDPVGLSLLRPRGFQVGHHRVRLGRGSAAFTAARAALEAWSMFDLRWVELFPRGAPIVVGTNVAVLAHHFGLWSLNGCRVVRLLSDSAAGTRFGFAYGTLEEHVECGEELFAVELDVADTSVWYEVRAVSRPRSLVARVGYPLARRLQARFRRDSASAMAAAVAAADNLP